MFDTDNSAAAPAPERKPARAKSSKKKGAKIKAPKKKPKKAAPAKQRKATAPKSEKAGPRAGSKLALIHGLLTRPGGCTRAEILAATEWPSCSVPQQAAALGMELKSSKEKGEPTRYWVD